jgi:RNA polymerase sigma-70 factor (ECF subfamily)
MRARRSANGATLSEIEAVYRERFAEFRRVAAAIVGDRDAALDVVQEAFGSAIRSRRTFRRSGPLEGWVWRMVVNTARDHRRLPQLATRGVAEAPPQNGHADRSAALAAAIAALPERQRLTLFLRYYADLDYRGIAEALGVQPGTVAATLNAAHLALRRTLLGVSR